MNQLLEDAVVSNLSSSFPDAVIYTSRVEQGIEPDNIIIETVLDNFEILSTNVRNTTTMVQVSVIQPTTDINQLKSLLSQTLMSFNIDGEVYEVDTITFANVDNILHSTFAITYREVIQ